jgi:16S rRNA (guanine966-N2)-methyltransferase
MRGRSHGRATPKSRSHERGTQARRLRIIAGRWRGRRWQFPAADIRPTSDRVRETLYNWLQGKVSGRRCLDLYAGSGALGLEALSRGAAHCVFVDRNARVIAALADVLRDWDAEPGAIELVHAEAAQFLARTPRAFDLVFLDPPFAAAVLAEDVAALTERGWLAPGCHIYIEHPRRAELSALPAGWQPLRSGAAGTVGYDLYVYR